MFETPLDPTDPYDPRQNAATFDFWGAAQKVYDDPLMETPESRVVMTRLDPFAFALLYFLKHLTDDQGVVSFSDAHLEWLREARLMGVKDPNPYPAKHRHAYIAPRSMGKSTWWFLIFPMWLAAHSHAKFIAAFADTGPQAEQHLKTFKMELDTNDFFRQDYPEVVRPLTRKGQARALADNQTMYLAHSGFAFVAKGIDSGNLGAKIGDQRPDVLIFDDLEPGEANYSAYQMEKRLDSLLTVALPLNVAARVVMVGTVTMPESITHQLVKHEKLGLTDGWVYTNNFKVHHTPAIIEEEDGTRRSVWPEKWPLDYLESIEGTREYLKNYANDPMGADGDYWRADMFVHEDLELTHKIISIDPAVTNKKSSDFTGVSVVGYSATERRCQVVSSKGVRMTPSEIRTYVLGIIGADPEIGRILIETNQGGDTWSAILHDMPVPVDTVHQTVKKEVRAAQVVVAYERGFVTHSRGLTSLEEQMVAFPKAPHDDQVDSVTSAIAYFGTRMGGGQKAVARPRVLGSRPYV